MARHNLEYLRERAYFHADLLSGGSVKRERANDCVNASLARLHSKITGLGEEYVLVDYQFALVVDQESYTLPADFRRLREIFLVTDEDRRLEIARFNLKDLGQAWPISQAFVTTANWVRYRIIGQRTLRFYPKPQSTDTVEVWYVPEFQKLVSDIDELPEYIAPGWEEYACVCAAIDMLQSLGRDTTTLERREAYLWADILRDLTPRDQSGPATVTDVSRMVWRDVGDW